MSKITVIRIDGEASAIEVRSARGLTYIVPICRMSDGVFIPREKSENFRYGTPPTMFEMTREAERAIKANNKILGVTNARAYVYVFNSDPYAFGILADTDEVEFVRTI